MSKFYTDEEYKKLMDARLKWLSNDEDRRTFEEIREMVLGKDRYAQILAEEKRWDEEHLLFRVCHPDGSEWTNKELEEWVLAKGRRTALNYCDLDGFYIDCDGGLALLDECGNFEFLDQDEFIVQWNEIPLRRILEEQ